MKNIKKPIRIKFQNGLTGGIALKEILNELTTDFDFIESENPAFILFGPYGNDIPKPGPYIRIGYFCENIVPDFSICEWAFGVPREEEINHPKYKRIQWHGFNPENLVKLNTDSEKLLASKSKFCNFLYSNKVPYREEFFKQLSKYKKVDAPGKSMNNMASIDNLYQGSIWERKRQFLSEYKFTIAFENYAYSGYQTEKLYDAMITSSIPIYNGDSFIHEIFNTKSFINAPEYLPIKNSNVIKWLEKSCQPDFNDYRPQFFHSSIQRVKRKIKSKGRELKMKLQFNKLDFSNLIDRIIEVDKNPELYLQYLKEPWFKYNIIPENLSSKNRWIEIFDSI